MQEVLGGQLYRGPRPNHGLSFLQLQRAGIKSVISLQSGFQDLLESSRNRELSHCLEYGLHFAQIYMHPLLPPSKESLALALEAFKRLPKPVYVHCKHGKDRTGSFVAFFRVRYMHVTPTVAIHQMKLDGFHSWCFGWWIPILKRSL